MAVPSLKVMLMDGVAGAVPVQVMLTVLLFPDVELEALTQEPEEMVQLHELMSAPPSASSA